MPTWSSHSGHERKKSFAKIKHPVRHLAWRKSSFIIKSSHCNSLQPCLARVSIAWGVLCSCWISGMLPGLCIPAGVRAPQDICRCQDPCKVLIRKRILLEGSELPFLLKQNQRCSCLVALYQNMQCSLIKGQRVYMHSAKPENVLSPELLCVCVLGMGRRLKNREGCFSLAYGEVFIELVHKNPRAGSSLCLVVHLCLKLGWGGALKYMHRPENVQWKHFHETQPPRLNTYL